MTQRLKVRNSIRAIRTLALATVVAGSLSVANATVTYSIASGGLESFNVTIDSTTINGALAGGILLNEVSSSDPSMPGSYTTVCTDIGGTLYLGQNYTYNTPPTSFVGQTGVQPPWGIPSDGSAAQLAIQNAAYLFYTYGQLTGTGIGLSSTTMKAALQLAVWEALYNTTTSGNVITGNGARFSVTSGDAGAIAQANTWVSSLTGNYHYDGYLLYPDPVSGGINANADGKPPQELLIGTPVPEAPTVIAGVLLLLPFAASAFKILRKQCAIKS